MPRILGLDIGPTSVRGVLVRVQRKRAEVLQYIEVPIDLSPVEAAVVIDAPPTEGVAIGPAAEPATAGEIAVPADVQVPIAVTAAEETVPGAIALVGLPDAPTSEEGPSSEPAPLPGPRLSVPAFTTPTGRAVDQLKRSLVAPADQIIVALSGVDVSLRLIELPAGAQKRVADVLPFEMESLVPFDLEESVLDHQPIELAGGLFRVLAAAASKDRVRKRLSELSSHGVAPRGLSVGAASLDGLIPVMPELESAEPVLVLDLGQEMTDLAILRGGACHLAKTVSSGTTQIARLETTLKRALTAYRATGAPAPVKGILTGDAATDPHAIEWLSAKLEIPFLPLSPPAPAPSPSLTVPATPESELPRFGKALALAAGKAAKTKRLDLLKDEFTPEFTSGFFKQHGKVLAACAGLVLVSFVFAVAARYYLVKDENNALRARLANVTEASFGVGTEDPDRAADLLERGAQQTDPLPRFDAYDILHTLSDRVPTEITHNARNVTIELDDDGHGAQLDIQGSVGSVAERDQISALLAEHECVREIEQGRTSAGAGGMGLNYQMEATIRCPGAPEPESRRGRNGR